jgi:hypothetical protein
MDTPVIGTYYKHWKGTIYRIIPCPKYADNGEDIVEYGDSYSIDSLDYVWYQDIKTNQVYRRDLQEFMSLKVFDDGTERIRFHKYNKTFVLVEKEGLDYLC